MPRPAVLDCYVISPPGLAALTAACSTSNGGLRVGLLTGVVAPAA
jgi:hypothetical protein